MKLIRPAVGLATLALVAAACGGGGGDDAASSTTVRSTTTTTEKATTTSSSSTSTSSTTTTEVPATIRQPLTGEPLESVDQIINRPALVAKIDNNRAAVPNHSGLAVADIVYEEVVEGRTTRLAAVFHSQSSDPIGPIRSGRTQDIALFTPLIQPLFVWSGGNPSVTALVNASFLVNMGPSAAQGYYRGPGKAPHNLYTSTDVIWGQTPADSPGAPPQQFQYLEAGETFGGDPSGGAKVKVGSESIEWNWNPEFSKFDRSQFGKEHFDKVFGRIRATNVIVMGVDYQPSGADRNSPEAQTIGEGPAWFFSAGAVVAGTWKREGANIYPVQYFGPDGAEIRFDPGNTWIELADNNDVTAGGVELLPL